MQVDKLSKTLFKITLTRDAFNVNLVASTGLDGILLVDTGGDQTAEELNEKIGELDDGIGKMDYLYASPWRSHRGKKCAGRTRHPDCP